ncbi:hypothetical protein INT45_007935 [Circinella minor]|uniref:Uncharacterized protein n=1 Tax=Circinella minor TaxID=1195481 RepID=A0A8H7VL74_9FUNG|nr:hypothetical protein INT45_007935 [Circinella minor]
MNTSSFRNSSVRNSLIATTRPVSRRWKKLVTKFKAFRKQQHEQRKYDMDFGEELGDENDDYYEKLPCNNNYHSNNDDHILKPRNIGRRHSSDELSRKAVFPYYIDEEQRQNDDESLNNVPKKKKKDSASLSALHHISLPAGPVSSALSPPPRHTMTKRKLIEPPTSRSPVFVRLSVDLREEEENEERSRTNSDSSSFRQRHPFRSGTLGNHNDDVGFIIPTVPVPDIPLKERRKRRSPLSIPDELTLSLNNNKKSASVTTTVTSNEEESPHSQTQTIKQRRQRHTYYYHQKPERRSSISSITSGSSTSSSVISEERNKAMNALEGLDRDKAQYDAVVGRRRATNTNTATTMNHDEPTPSLTPSSRPLYYPSSPSSVGTIVEEAAKFTISAGAVCSSSSPPPPVSPPPPPLPSSRIPESLRHYKDL